MKKTILYFLILVSAQAMAQQTLEKGIQTLILNGATIKKSAIEISGTNNIQNNKAVSPTETALEEINLYFDVTVSSLDNEGTFRYGVGKQARFAGTYIEVYGDSAQSKITINKMDTTSIHFVKEYELPFIIKPGEAYKIRLGKCIRNLIVELSSEQRHFIIDTLKYPSPFFGMIRGIPFIACANGTISISDYELSTPLNLSPRLAVWGDSFIEGCSLDNEKQRYISLLKDSIGYENIAIMGKGGEKSASLNNRFITETEWFAGATYALLAIGLNDKNFDTWKTNLINDVARLKQKGITPIIATITPREDRNDFIIQANKWIRTCYNGAYIDINKVVATNDTSWIAGACMPDKIHPTAAMHQKIFCRISEEAPYLFRDSKTFTIDYVNEITSENVINSIQYSTSSNFSTVESGANNAVALTPGVDLYFGSVTSDKIKCMQDILLVPDRPAIPINSGAFMRGSFDWVNTPGFNAITDYEYSSDNGITWTTCYEKPIKNNNAEYMDVRVKASSGNFKSLALRIDFFTTIASQELKRIGIYPNPVKNILTIDHLTGEANAAVYASDSRLVNTLLLTHESNSISMQALQKGIYMLVITTDKGESRTLKFLKED